MQAQSPNQRLAEAIRQIGQNGFEEALRVWLESLLPFDSFLAMAFRDQGVPLIFYSQAKSPAVFAELATQYVSAAYLFDPCLQLHAQGAAPGLYRLRDIAPDAFPRSQFYQDYYQKTTLVDELTFLAYPGGQSQAGVSLNICLGRDGGPRGTGGRAFSAREKAAAAAAAPIVIALCERHWIGLSAPRMPDRDLAGDLAERAEKRLGLHLSTRQAEVALLILRGHSTPSVALQLGVSVQTVKVFRRQLYARCGISSQAELFALMLPLLNAI